MKTIILMRHSIAKKINISTEDIPLSDEGINKAYNIRKEINNIKIDKYFSSFYLRAKQTANILSNQVTIINDLHERIIGIPEDDFWIKQYKNYDYKNVNGESLNEVKERMNKAINFILSLMKDNETVLVVSHATAICSYLLNFCVMEINEEATKSRKITFNNKVVINGNIEPTNYFILKFESNIIKDIEWCKMKT